jgi:Family of unknown function (DUF5329)
MRPLHVALLALAASATALAAPTASPVRAEIDALLARLQASGCEFNRNGSWYSGTEARAHLLRKLEYLEGRGTVLNAEQFIDQAASSSSSSGTPYLVKCGNAKPVQSKQWLLAELDAVRSASRSGAAAR